MNLTTFILFLVAAVFTATGQLLVKQASGTLHSTLNDSMGWGLGGWMKRIFTIVFEPHILFAMVLYLAVLFLWLKIVDTTELNFAYPLFISVTMILTSVASTFIFKEALTGLKIAGIFSIILGIFLMTAKS